MSSAHPNTPISNTPQPSYPNVVVVTTSAGSSRDTALSLSGPETMDSTDGTEGEERDAFSLEVLPGKTTSSTNYARTGPVPVLHHFSLNQHYHHCGLNAAANSRNLPSPASQPQSLTLPPVNPTLSHVAAEQSGSSSMSRSISDSTLRRAALHLNLNQSVLPSFTSLQQFKVCISLAIKK